jgi:hypothetical protein
MISYNTIKKKLKQELKAKKGSGGANFLWHHFDLANRIWKSIPKKIGILRSNFVSSIFFIKKKSMYEKT